MPRKRTEIPIEQVDAYLARCAQLATPPRVSEFADAVGVSRVTVNHRFKEMQGVSLSDYFAARRDYLATDLLAGSDLKTEAVATRAGFGTLRSFQRAFARKFGVTPARLRRLIKTSPN